MRRFVAAFVLFVLVAAIPRFVTSLSVSPAAAQSTPDHPGGPGGGPGGPGGPGGAAPAVDGSVPAHQGNSDDD